MVFARKEYIEVLVRLLLLDLGLHFNGVQSFRLFTSVFLVIYPISDLAAAAADDDDEYHDDVSKVTRERSGSVVECLTRDRGVEPHRRHCVVVLEQDTFILA